MDADNRIIPLVEDDQGEGVKDPLELDDIMDLYSETLEESREELFKHLVKKKFEDGDKPESQWDLPSSKGPVRGRDRR